MKKFVVMLCILTLMLSATTVAFAATETVATVVTFEDANHDLYEEQTVEITDGVSMIIPASFAVATKGDTVVMTDGTHTIEVTESNAEESVYTSLADAKKAFIERNLQGSMVEMTINGLPALGVVTEDGTYMVMLMAPDGRMVTVKFPDFDTADDEYKEWIVNMIKTIIFA